MMNDNRQALDILTWYRDAGVDEAISDHSTDFFAIKEDAAPTPMPAKATSSRQPPVAATTPASPRTPQASSVLAAGEAANDARVLAQSCTSLEDLKAAMAQFDGCGLKATATNMVFGDGAADARIMFIGEAPGRDE
ncbi:MAG TPA: uracil-DNA glycosylase, partial [Rhizobiales bacterium]|nr:uracil-DNA glycosylase [Hyphomicrobiales bacterium]